MSTIDDIKTALAAYELAVDTRNAKKTFRNEKFAALQVAETQFETAQDEYVAAANAANAAEQELQRVNDEHSAEPVEPPPAPEEPSEPTEPTEPTE